MKRNDSSNQIEALGRKRGGTDTGGGAHNAMMSTLTVLLRKVEEYQGYLLGATNRPEDLDPALWRRFHMQLEIGMPGPDERFAILKRYLAPFDWPDEAFDLLTDLTTGASPALMRGVMEGVKRALVLAPRLSRSAADAGAVFQAVLASVQPPPDTDWPPLWRSRSAIADIGALPWPPVRTAD